MQKIKELVKQAVDELPERSSFPPSRAESPAPKTIKRSEKGELSVSMYADIPATDADVATQMARLFACFPNKDPLFWSVLSERIEANGFTTERLKDAVAHVLDTFHYKELNVADVISYDRRVRLYTGREYVNAQMNGAQPSEFERREIGGTLYWVKKADLLRTYNFDSEKVGQ